MSRLLYPISICSAGLETLAPMVRVPYHKKCKPFFLLHGRSDRLRLIGLAGSGVGNRWTTKNTSNIGIRLHTMGMLFARYSLLLTTILLPSAIFAIDPVYRRVFEAIKKKQNITTLYDEPDTSDDVQQRTFLQRLDHFTTGDRRTFAQRYFVSDRYVRTVSGHRSLYFICVGGEGPPLTKRVLVDSVHCTGDMLETARILYNEREDLSIHLLALEHRFYGQSFPFNTSTVDQLQYLSSRQATADLAHFVRILTRGTTDATTDPTNSNTVILFGGSYPGMVAAFTRHQYPHLISGAVSHSAPVQAQLDFGAYNGHVGRVLPTDLCRKIMHEGHSELAAKARNDHETFLQYAKQFPICDVQELVNEPRNLELWLGDGVVDLSVQGNDPACTTNDWCDLEKKCTVLEQAYRTNGGNAIHALATLAHFQHSNLSTDCVDVDWLSLVSYVADPTQQDGLRSWIWQTCTEFGFYQTCDTHNTDCPYAQGMHRVDQDIELCKTAFPGIPVPDQDMIANTNEWSGGWWADDDFVLSVVGTVDPWTELAAQAHVSVEGASHHFWTHPVRATDSAAVQDARKLVTDVVRSWALPPIHATRMSSNGEMKPTTFPWETAT